MYLLQQGHLLSQLGDVFSHLAVQHPSLNAADHRLAGTHRGVALHRWVQRNRQQSICNFWAGADELVVGARQGLLHLLLDVALSYREILPLQEVPIAGHDHVGAMLPAVACSSEGLG